MKRTVQNPTEVSNASIDLACDRGSIVRQWERIAKSVTGIQTTGKAKKSQSKVT